MSSPAQVTCPTCRKRGDWFSGKYGPFCSHRCKLIDLGRWFTGEYTVSSPLRPGHLERFVGLPAGEIPDPPATDERS